MITSGPAPVRPAPRLSLVEGGKVPSSRLRDVQARIQAGYYDRDDVRSRLADAVLRLMHRP